MITEQHIEIINTTFEQYDVNLIAKRYRINNNIYIAEDTNHNLLCTAPSIEDKLTLQVTLDNYFVEIDLPLEFDKEVLVNTVREVLKCKVTSLQNSLNKVNSLLGDML